MNNSYYIIAILIGLLVIIGLSIYIAYKTSNNNTVENMKNKNYKFQPGDGFYIKPGGNKQDTNNIHCENCLAQANQDGADPSYYYGGRCHHSEEFGAFPPEGISISVKGIQDTRYNTYTCPNPGKVTYNSN